MLILSQDKDSIINFNNIVSIWINSPLENNEGEFEIRAESDNTYETLGYYKTEERAKDILYEIFIMNKEFNYKMPEN